MFGALIGDLIGSVYEWNNIKTKDFQPLIAPKAFLTDDSVLTVAVADALLHRRPMAESLKDWGRRYPDSDWGGRFARWLFSEDDAPYNSFGNGSATPAFLRKLAEHGLWSDACEDSVRRAEGFNRLWVAAWN